MSESAKTCPQPSVFTRIINGDLPGRFVWADELCVAFATIEPQTTGHVLVVPRQQVESYIDADDATIAHLAVVAKRIAATQVRVFQAVRPGIVVVGMDVAHLHIHVLPLHQAADVSPAKAHGASAEALDAAMHTLRAGLRADGWEEFVPPSLHSPLWH